MGCPKTVGITAELKTYWRIPNSDPTKSQNEMKAVLATIGPVTVAIDASSTQFMMYKSGVLAGVCGASPKLTHAVLVVGYGNGYWIIKNSWGITWVRIMYREICTAKHLTDSFYRA